MLPTTFSSDQSKLIHYHYANFSNLIFIQHKKPIYFIFLFSTFVACQNYRRINMFIRVPQFVIQIGDTAQLNKPSLSVTIKSRFQKLTIDRIDYNNQGGQFNVKQLIYTLMIITKQMNKEQEEEQYGSYFAYSIMALSNVTFVMMEFSFKHLTQYFDSQMVISARGGLLFLMNIFMLQHNNIGSHMKDPSIFKLLIKRSTVSFFTVVLYLTSLKYIPIGIANALQNTSPIVTFFIEVFYYKKEKIHWTNLFITLASFAGILLIIQPQFIFGSKTQASTQSHTIYYVMVILGAFTSSFSMLFLHDLRHKCHELVALHHTYFFQAAGGSVLYMFFHKDTHQKTMLIHELPLFQIVKILIYLVMMVIFAFATQYLRTKSIFMCSPALIMPFNYFAVVFGLILDLLVFGSHYNATIILGMILSCLGLFSKFILLYIRQKQQQHTHHHMEH